MKRVRLYRPATFSYLTVEVAKTTADYDILARMEREYPGWEVESIDGTEVGYAS